MKLFRARSVVNDFREFDEVEIDWFYVGRKQPVAPYEELIADYQSIVEDWELQFAEQAVDEYFTEEEIKVLRTYLQDRPDGLELEVTEIPLPAHVRQMMPFGATPMGGAQDCIVLARQSNYHPLPFKVHGFYDLRLCEPFEPSEPEPEEWDEISEEDFEDIDF